jgi:hypothetical protein
MATKTKEGYPNNTTQNRPVTVDVTRTNVRKNEDIEIEYNKYW